MGVGAVRWDEHQSCYRLWYYCRDKTFNDQAPSALGTGRIATATSDDGIHWDRVIGPSECGSVLSPGTDTEEYDFLHLGMTDVTYAEGKWWLWCFGGNTELLKLPSVELVGYRMRPGLAVSDDGLNWDKVRGSGLGGAALDYDADDIFASWTNGLHDGEKFVMFYTATAEATGPFRTEYAVSETGEQWDKRGEIKWLDDLRPWDANGIMTRHIQRNILGGPKKWLMLYTALDGSEVHFNRRTIAAAVSDDLVHWSHLHDAPIFSSWDENAWDGGGVSGPQLIQRDGKLLLYYYGFPKPDLAEALPKGIGLAISEDGTLENFKRIES